MISQVDAWVLVPSFANLAEHHNNSKVRIFMLERLAAVMPQLRSSKTNVVRKIVVPMTFRMRSDPKPEVATANRALMRAIEPSSSGVDL